MTTANVLRIGTTPSDGQWTGVLRDGRKVVLTCGHEHQNRDTSSQTNGQSARDCITKLVKAARFPAIAEDVRKAILRGPNEYIRRWQATPSMAAQLREAAAKGAEAFTARLPEVAAVLGDRPVFGFMDHVAVAPPQPEGVTCACCGQSIFPKYYSALVGWHDWHDDTNFKPGCPAPGFISHKPADTSSPKE